MKAALQTIVKHPVAIAIYLLYSYFSFLILRGNWRYKQALPIIDSGERVAWGEGVMYGVVLLFFVAVIFATGVVIASLFYKEEKKFYLWLLSGIITPLLFWFVI
jgi:hypothetical protein